MTPSILYAGTTWAWIIEMADYSAADGWSLKYILTNTATAIEFTDDGTATGTTFSINVPASTTTTFDAGDYTWHLFAVKGTDERFVGTCPVTVKANITGGATPLDDRSHVKKTLDAIEAMIEDKATRDQQSYSVAGRSLSRYSFEELLNLRSQYRALYNQECDNNQIAAGGGNPNIIKTTFKGVS